ncbi:MAG: sulfotransferase [Deltaproteobacteria bacterium]|jgi:hypothetical protein|nr:sulfotransferase [Deltaproteobacteria bacterium]
MARVNLFVIGAMKSGSTTLHDYLSEHRDVFMSPVKEPGFFVPEIWGDRRADEYLALFRNVHKEKYIGESSTHYTKQPTYKNVADRIFQYNPESKIIYIVRNPILRTISHYYHNKRDLERHAEIRPIIKAIESDVTYTAYSNYAMQIKPYIVKFGFHNVMVLTLESLIAEPEKAMRELYDWLEVDSLDISVSTKRSNAAPAIYKKAGGLGLLNRFRYSLLWGKMASCFPQFIKDFCNRLAVKEEIVGLQPEVEKEVYSRLSPIFIKNVKELTRLTNRSFDEWQL